MTYIIYVIYMSCFAMFSEVFKALGSKVRHRSPRRRHPPGGRKRRHPGAAALAPCGSGERARKKLPCGFGANSFNSLKFGAERNEFVGFLLHLRSFKLYSCTFQTPITNEFAPAIRGNERKLTLGARGTRRNKMNLFQGIWQHKT